MPTLADIREQYPQYSDMSDGALASALHQKFYSDIPRAEFDAKIGLKPTAPAAAPKRTAEPAVDAAPVDQPMGEGLGSAIMDQVPTDTTAFGKKTFTGSVFDTQPFNPPFNPEEAARLSRRDYAERSMQPARRPPPSMTESPEYVGRSRTAGETAVDLTAALSKGTTGFFKGILNNLPGDPGTALFEGLLGTESRAERLTSPITKGSDIARQGRIARAQEMGGELGAAEATLRTMFTPAGMQVITQGAGSIIPSLGMGLVGLSAKAIGAMNMLSNAGDAAVQSAEQLKQISPEQWSKNDVYRTLRDKGLSHRDTVSMLAPIYALPAQAAGAATGYISGRTGLEKALTQGAEKGLKAAAGRFGAEQLGEQLESLTPQFVGNLVASTIDPKISPVQGLGQTAVETAFGSLPGSALAALPSKRVNALNAYAQSKGYTDVQDMIRKIVPTVGRKAAEDELIEALDRQTDEEDARTEQRTQGAPSVRPPVTPTDRAGVPMAGQPGAVTPAAGAGISEPTGVVSPRQDAATVAEGERIEPTAVKPWWETASDISPDDINYKGEPAPEAPQKTPLHAFMDTGSSLEKFYDSFIARSFGDTPEPLKLAHIALDQANEGLTFITDRLAKWNHPAITGANQGARAHGKATATVEDRQLLDIKSEIAGLASRIATQAMAIEKGYKGKKAGSAEKIKQAYDDLDKLGEIAIQRLYERGLLTDEEAVEWEQQKEREAMQAEPTAIEAPTEEDQISFEEAPKKVEAPKISFDPKDKTDEELEAIVDDFIGVWEPEERKAAKDELEQRRGVSEQQVPTPKPAPTTDVNTPTTPGESTTPKPVEDKPYYGSDEINALGDKIKDTVNNITSDFMVGDMVRYGNIQGTVVGKDDTHVKIHPFGAVSPKAYHRVPKTRVELIDRPDTTKNVSAMAMSGEDKKFGTEQGKLNADMGGLIQLLGANMYAGSVAEVAVKELLQNAFDAVKGAISNKKAPSLYKSGEITITIDDRNRTITVTDNARGMTPEIVRDAFFTVAGSDKSDLDPPDRSGGLGLAKMGFMLGSEQLILDTVSKGVRVRVDTSAKDIAASNFQIVKSPAPKGEHGTSVTVKIPEYYVDPKTGDKKDIYFSGNPNYYDSLQQPLIGPVVVKTERKGIISESNTLPVGLNFPADKYIQFKVNFAWGSADIYFSKERNPGKNFSIKHQVLSSGVYQFNTDFKLNEQEKIPYDLIVNIKPNVEAKHPDYPFENNRERFKARLKEDISSLNEYLAQIARGNEAADLQENFKNIVSMPRVELGADIADTTQKLRKSFDKRGTAERRELPPMPTEVRVEGTRVIAVDTGKTVADRAKKEEKQTKGTFQAEKEAPKGEDFMLQMQQDPKLPVFHNNTNVDYLEIGRQYGEPEKFFAELGTLMVEMKEILGKSGLYGYDKLKPENLFFGGVSIDKGYGGVHLRGVPYKAVFINPFYDFGAKTLSGVRRFLMTTFVHEIAHTTASGHNVGHNTQMAQVEQYLEDIGMYDYFADSLLDMLMRHESTFTAMRDAYGRSTTKNTSKSLKDYEEGSASESVGRDSGSSEDELRAISAVRRPSGDEILRAAGTVNPTSGIPRAAGSTAPASVKGLHQDVVDAINSNDIRATLQAVARNASGFYSELAKRLSALNLPTNIIFNNQRALVKKVIDDRSAQQQIRLFAYLSREAPAFYNQYFKDYDKAENLERVFEGLRKLPGSGINIGPVNAELADVRYAYNKSMPGLTAPGFFAPTLDTVNITPDSRFGTNYRVLLHEIVHAATDYIFAEKVPLTPEQAQAKKDLLDMYAFAQTKLSPGEYGFTNISEFVAEAMTNKKFQDKLRAIAYPPRKTTLFNRFLQVVAEMFGLDNLAGASMSAINELMSAQRPAGVSPMPLVFAQGKKRVRGPISKPDSWRTAESVQTSAQEVLSDATKGRVLLDQALKKLAGPLWDASGTVVRAAILPVLQLRQLKDLTRTRLPQLGGAVDIVEKMVSYRGQKIKVAEDIVQKWSKLQSESPKQSSLMGRIMIEATIRGRDPDAGVPLGGAPDALDNAWNGLRPEFQQLYRDVREFYANAVKDMVRTMKTRALGLPKAQRQAMIRKINEQFGPQKLAYPYFPLRRFGTKWFQVGQGNFKEFYTFDNVISRNYAFQKRRDQLQNGNAQQQAAAESMRRGNGISQLYSQNIATTQVLRDVEDIVDGLTSTSADDLKAEIKDSINQLVYLLLPEQSMRKMFINRKAVQGASGDMLRVFAHSAVHSAYQQARFKFAEPFIDNISKANEYIDDLEGKGPKGGGIRIISAEQAEVYRDYVRELEDRTKVVLGTEDTSQVARVVGGVTNTTFYFMLSAPASVLLNTVGMAVLTMPRIGARYGYAKTNALMLKNSARYAGSAPTRTLAPLAAGQFMQVSFPSIVEGGKLSPLLQRAAERFIDDGDINISMTNDIFSLGERPSALYTGKTNAVKKLMSGLFHQGERFNREVALLTAFELAYEKFLDADRKDIRGIVERDPATGKPVKYTPGEAFDLAIQEARDIAGLTLGDFTRQMKGKVFAKYPALNVVTQFKQYAITTTYNILRDLYEAAGRSYTKAEIEQFRQQMIKEKRSQAVIDQRIDEAIAYRKEIYREAFKRMAGVLGMAYLFGGVVAMPFFSMLGVLIQMFAPDDDDEFFDWENWFYNYMENEVGGAAASIFTKMGMDTAKSERAGIALGEALARGPVAAVTGTALADRVSLDLKNLWWREGRYSPDAREALQQEAIANFGPSLGLALNWADAWQLAGEGQYLKAYEKAAPALFSKPATAYRLGTEGATNRAGDVVGGMYPEEFTTWQLAMQAIGLQPEKLAQAQKAAIQAKTYQQKVFDRRTALLNRLWMERGTPSFADALQKANEFSLRFPEVAIDGDAIAKSFDARAEAKAQAEAMGAKLDEKLIGRTGPMMRYGMQ